MPTACSALCRRPPARGLAAPRVHGEGTPVNLHGPWCLPVYQNNHRHIASPVPTP